MKYTVSLEPHDVDPSLEEPDFRKIEPMASRLRISKQLSI